MVSPLVRATYDPSSTTQVSLGAQDGDGEHKIPTSGMETHYNASEVCPGCGNLMTPLQVIYGYGLCPDCQSRANAQHVKDRMSHGI